MEIELFTKQINSTQTYSMGANIKETYKFRTTETTKEWYYNSNNSNKKGVCEKRKKVKEKSLLKSKNKENAGEEFSNGKLLTQAKMLVTETRSIHRRH